MREDLRQSFEKAYAEAKAKKKAAQTPEQKAAHDAAEAAKAEEARKKFTEKATKMLTADGAAPPPMPWPEALGKSIVTSAALRKLRLKPRVMLLDDWFAEGDLGFVFAPRGVGKTWVGIGLAEALSLGTKIGPWKAHAPVPILYTDGEMPADMIRSRMQGLELSPNQNLTVLNHEVLFDATGRSMNITHFDLQNAITEHCLNTGVKVLILDNLSTLAGGMKENAADDWELVNAWLLTLRRHRIAVIIIHHAGRSGEMRGTSRREDNVFWIIALDDLKKFTGTPEERMGAHFITRFTKSSRNTQRSIPAYRWHFVTDEKGVVNISCEHADEAEVFRKLVEEGVVKNSEIAEEMKVSTATISRIAHRAIKAGWLKVNRNREYEIIGDGPPADDSAEPNLL